ncbi:MAG: hypothetical protein SWO11_08125 [Thermodesulfobacteriota bacterium]|nr:hypothetical protein [Thermodesulfobacteriota bacterium]
MFLIVIRGEQYYQFTAIDDCSTWRFANIYPQKSTYSVKDFVVNRLIKEAPFSYTLYPNGWRYGNYQYICLRPRMHP